MGELDTANGNSGCRSDGMLGMANADVTRLMGELDSCGQR